MLAINSIAPDFALYNQDNELVRLSDFRGKKVVLYFYPKDNTPGCTKQACAFKAMYSRFLDQNIVVLGVSKDSVAAHRKFVDKYELPFILLSDPDTSMIQAYDVWKEKISRKNLHGNCSFYLYY